jgi:hypothetical protein
MDKKFYLTLNGFFVSLLLLFIPNNVDFLSNSIIDVGNLTQEILHYVQFFAFILLIIFAGAIISRAIKSIYSKT